MNMRRQRSQKHAPGSGGAELTRRGLIGGVISGAIGLVLAATWAIAPAAESPARAAEACEARTARCACQAAGWRQLGQIPIPPGFGVNALGGSAGLDRIYASTGTAGGSSGQKAYSGLLDQVAWPVLPDFQGNPAIPITDILADTDQPRIAVWISGQSTGQIAQPVFGATAASPTVFNAQGSLTWVTQLATAGGVIYAASGQPKGIHAWDEAGRQWNLAGGATIPTRAFWAMTSGGGRLWVGTDSYGVWSSPEGGASWTQSLGGAAIERATIRALAVDDRDPEHLVIAAGLGPQADLSSTDPGFRGLRISRDGGQSWANPSFTNVDLIAAIAFSRRRPNQIYAATFGSGVQVSGDGGQSWASLTPPGTAMQRTYDLMTLIPQGEASCEILVAGGDGGVWALNIGAPTTARVFLPIALQCSSSAGGGAGCPSLRATLSASPKHRSGPPAVLEAPPAPTAPAILPPLPPEPMSGAPRPGAIHAHGDFARD